MLLKLKKAFPIIIFAVVTVAIGSVLFEKCGNGVDQKSFLIKMDSLNKVNDSLNNQIAKDDAVIDSLNEVDAVLSDKLAHQKTKVIKIVETIEIEKNNIDSYNEQELVSSFYKRYPTDTVSNPLPVAQPVLVAAAKDLVELDGAKQIIIVKDSVIALTEARVNGKDSVIAVFVKKDVEANEPLALTVLVFLAVFVFLAVLFVNPVLSVYAVVLAVLVLFVNPVLLDVFVPLVVLFVKPVLAEKVVILEVLFVKPVLLEVFVPLAVLVFLVVFAVKPVALAVLVANAFT